jgi:TrmH family RNA methyltransferase
MIDLQTKKFENLQGIKELNSKNNKLIRTIQKIIENPTAYRQEKMIWIEGEHLCQAFLNTKKKPLKIIFSHSFLSQNKKNFDLIYQNLNKISEKISKEHWYVVPDNLFKLVSSISSIHRSCGFGLLIPYDSLDFTENVEIQKISDNAILLDRLQDTGNIGSILRCAAAFGIKKILALQGTAALWSTKVLRAGMGAHFNLDLIENLTIEKIKTYINIPMIGTDSHTKKIIYDHTIPNPCVWIFGNEGQGIRNELHHLSDLKIKIPQPGGEESLNVATAAAICLYESMRQMKMKSKSTPD